MCLTDYLLWLCPPRIIPTTTDFPGTLPQSHPSPTTTTSVPFRRPLSDLCIIAVVKQLKPADQLKASQMSPRCFRLVRAANRRVRSLVITNCLSLEILQVSFYWNFFPSSRSMQLWAEDAERNCGRGGGPPAPSAAVGHRKVKEARVSAWNSLQYARDWQHSLPTVEEVVSLPFSAVTSLKYVDYNTRGCNIAYLTALLQRPQWAPSQLVSLTVDVTSVSEEVLRPLFPAINRLPALQHLAIMLKRRSRIPDLPILARLKVVLMTRGHLPSFLASLERHALGNDQLQVHLKMQERGDEEALIALSEPLRGRIVRLIGRNFENSMPLLQDIKRFPSLTSLDLGLEINNSLKEPEVRTLFTALSQLPQLLHLKLEVDLRQIKDDSPARLGTQLNSVRALDLNLTITSHLQVEWLNLQWTLPHCQAIYLVRYSCLGCRVYMTNYFGDASTSRHASPCLRATLSKLHAGVPASRIALDFRKPYRTAEEVFAN